MSDQAVKVLIVEDELPVRRFLKTLLESNGFRVLEATSGSEGLSEASMRSPDLVLLDLGLPDVDGLEVTRRIREWTQIPIIVLSARGQERDKVDALNQGADDYLTKPFGAEELLARMRVALRHAARAGATADPIFELGELRVDFSTRRVFVAGTEVHLTPTEYKLLGVLVRHAGKVVTHNQLLKEVWGPTYLNQTDYIRTYMRQLRHKLEKDPAQPRFFINEPGVGYRLKVE